jgi:D-alanine-D-alanine ligase
MGGNSAEREISLKTGAGIVAALRRRGHRVWAGDPATGEVASGDRPDLAGGTTGASSAPGTTRERAPAPGSNLALADHVRSLLAGERSATDVVFIALHGGAGEDGTIQTVLELAGRPYTGSGPLASGLAMDKVMAKRLFVWAGVPTPDWVELAAAAALAMAGGAGSRAQSSPPKALAELGGLPIVVKPVDQGSTIGLTVVEAWAELAAAFAAAAPFGRRVLCERFIPGRELAIGVLGPEALPIVEIEPSKGIYDYECKYTKGMSRYTCPAALDQATTRAVSEVALKAFMALGCADFGRVDVRLSPDGRPYVLEVNTIPGMTETSLLPMAARAAGLSYEELVERMCELAAARAGRSEAALAGGRRHEETRA